MFGPQRCRNVVNISMVLPILQVLPSDVESTAHIFPFLGAPDAADIDDIEAVNSDVDINVVSKGSPLSFR